MKDEDKVFFIHHSSLLTLSWSILLRVSITCVEEVFYPLFPLYLLEPSAFLSEVLVFQVL